MRIKLIHRESFLMRSREDKMKKFWQSKYNSLTTRKSSTIATQNNKNIRKVRLDRVIDLWLRLVRKIDLIVSIGFLGWKMLKKVRKEKIRNIDSQGKKLKGITKSIKDTSLLIRSIKECPLNQEFNPFPKNSHHRAKDIHTNLKVLQNTAQV